MIYENIPVIYIYGLRDPITSEIKYIGQSKRPKNRHRTHIWKAINNYDTGLKSIWIKQLIEKNLEPELVILAICSKEQSFELENQYIQIYRTRCSSGFCNSNAPAESPTMFLKFKEETLQTKRNQQLERYSNKPHNPYMGVTPNGAGNFRTRFKKDGKRYELGSYPTAELAAKVWDSAMAYVFPNHTKFNFPEDVIPVAPEVLKERSSFYQNKTSKYFGIIKESRMSSYTAVYGKYKFSFPTELQAAYYRDCLERYYNPIDPKINLPEGQEGRIEALCIEDVRKISRLSLGKQPTKTSKYKYIIQVNNGSTYAFDFKIKKVRHREYGFKTELDAVRGFNNYITTNYINKPILIIK